MVGSAVTRHLIECGYEVIRLVRHTPGPGQVWWDPDAGEIDKAGLDGFDGVVHLATMPWPMRWTAKAKQQMSLNRLTTNRLLAESLAACEHKPRVLICASGMGYYPSSGDTVLTEDSHPVRVIWRGCNRMVKRPPPRQAKPRSGLCICVSHRSWAEPLCNGWVFRLEMDSSG